MPAWPCRWGSTAAVLILAALATAPAAAQPVTPVTCRAAVREAFGPLLPYPAATRTNVPEDGTAGSRWIVRWAPPDEMPLVIEVLENPYNIANQLRAERDMAAIREAVLAAELKAQGEYERALDEVRRTGRSADVDGVTLDDEGIVGERVDAEAQVEVACLPGVETDTLGSSVAPGVSPGPDGTWLLDVAANEYAEPDGSGGIVRRYRAAEWRLYAGAAAAPVVRRLGGDDRVELAVGPASGPSPAAAATVVLRGNAALVADLAGRVDWAGLVERLRRQP